MLKTVKLGITTLMLCGLAACSDSDNGGSGLIDPAGDPDRVTSAIGLKIGGDNAVIKNADAFPQPSMDANAPTVDVPDNVDAVNGAEAKVELTVSVNGAVAAIFAKIAGSGQFAEIRLSATSKGTAASPLELDVEIPERMADGTFCMDISIEDDQGLVSATDTTCLTVESTADDEPTPSPTPTATPEPTAEPTPAPTGEATPTPSDEPSPEPTATPEPSEEPSPSPSSTPEPTPSASPGTGTAAECFHPELLNTGTDITQTFTSTTSQGSLEFTDERTVTGPAQFEGQSTIETDGMTQSSDSSGNSATTQTQTYNQLDDANRVVKTVGVITTSQSEVPGFGTITSESKIVQDPPSELRFNLDAGESYTQTYTTTTTTTTSQGSFDSSGTTEETVTFIGKEAVSVPAGDFTACRFLRESSTTTGGQTSSSSTTVWMDVGTGLSVLQESGDTRSELTDASINGVSVR